MKLGETLNIWTGSTISWDWLYDAKRKKWPSFKNIYRRPKKNTIAMILYVHVRITIKTFVSTFTGVQKQQKSDIWVSMYFVTLARR